MIRVTLEQIGSTNDSTKQRYIMSDKYCEIGRDPRCELTIPPDLDYVSNRHLTVTIKEGVVLLDHIGSNQSYINRQPIGKDVVAQHNDIIDLTTIGPRYKIYIEKAKPNFLAFISSPKMLIVLALVMTLMTFTILMILR